MNKKKAKTAARLEGNGRNDATRQTQVRRRCSDAVMQ